MPNEGQICAQLAVLPYKNATLPVEERVSDLLSRMTLEEKVGQLLCPLGWEMYEIKSDSVLPSGKFKQLMENVMPVCYGLRIALIRGQRKRWKTD